MSPEKKQKLKHDAGQAVEAFRKWGVLLGTALTIYLSSNGKSETVDVAGIMGRIESKIDGFQKDVGYLTVELKEHKSDCKEAQAENKESHKSIWKAISKVRDNKLANR